ncbi:MULTISPECIES: hypothetical protein [Lactobacillaceae]|uniref:hypothetical protein n=1 Tax=Lactobacillaceae TaxID=33958 RepID=UPI0021C439E0|nr:hypothetical protein [Lacticaseibacillus paracasei]MCP9306125.1 hypothetical protein [Lacticaseibacillus paracasei]MCP9311583.1 hypothetical protein [Lacticaseibacillus paracasei]MCP9348286.1 hypothetical protein [Lacticaseibacillus paracasei]MCP9367837.1 hypothetical protein [Lacticaseibacillus paracasei]MCP9380243.1 hypothetical protein [Lacticaseibacillus paracasei]
MRDKYARKIGFESVSIKNTNLIEYAELLKVLKALVKLDSELNMNSDLDSNETVYSSLETNTIARIYASEDMVFHIYFGEPGEDNYPIILGESDEQILQVTQGILEGMKNGDSLRLAMTTDEKVSAAKRKIDEVNRQKNNSYPG